MKTLNSFHLILGVAKGKENDVRLFLVGEKLYASDPNLRPDGMRSSGDWKWAKLPKGPGSHTADAIRDDPVYFKVTRSGKHLFKIAHRSNNFAIDKVVMKLNNPDYAEELNGK